MIRYLFRLFNGVASAQLLCPCPNINTIFLFSFPLSWYIDQTRRSLWIRLTMYECVSERDVVLFFYMTTRCGILQRTLRVPGQLSMLQTISIMGLIVQGPALYLCWLRRRLGFMLEKMLTHSQIICFGGLPVVHVPYKFLLVSWSVLLSCPYWFLTRTLAKVLLQQNIVLQALLQRVNAWASDSRSWCSIYLCHSCAARLVTLHRIPL